MLETSTNEEWDMRIAIIGAGNVGGGLAGAVKSARHDVMLSNVGPTSAAA
jgi:predicted dinucleotide-binding enzyme